MINWLLSLRETLLRYLSRSCIHIFSGRKERKFVHLLPSPISQFASLDITFLSFVCAQSEISISPITCQALVSTNLRIKARCHGFEAMYCGRMPTSFNKISKIKLTTRIENNILRSGVFFAVIYFICTYFYAVLHKLLASNLLEDKHKLTLFIFNPQYLIIMINIYYM